MSARPRKPRNPHSTTVLCSRFYYWKTFLLHSTQRLTSPNCRDEFGRKSMLSLRGRRKLLKRKVQLQTSQMQARLLFKSCKAFTLCLFFNLITCALMLSWNIVRGTSEADRCFLLMHRGSRISKQRLKLISDYPLNCLCTVLVHTLLSTLPWHYRSEVHALLFWEPADSNPAKLNLISIPPTAPGPFFTSS